MLQNAVYMYIHVYCVCVRVRVCVTVCVHVMQGNHRESCELSVEGTK